MNTLVSIDHHEHVGHRTIWVPYFTEELHLGRVQRVVLGKLEFRRIDAAFEWGALGTLNQRLPDEQVILVDRTSGNAIGWIGQQ